LVEVTLGVDTHLDFRVAVAVDHLGREAFSQNAAVASWLLLIVVDTEMWRLRTKRRLGGVRG
jgi:hypothetical protein